MPTAGFSAQSDEARRLFDFASDSCRDWAERGAPAEGYGIDPAAESQIRFRGRQIGTRYRLRDADGAGIELEVISPGEQPTRFVASLFNPFGDPLLLVVLDRSCEMQVARRVDYSDDGQALSIVGLDEDFAPRGEPDWLNPPLEFVERDDEPAAGRGLRVGMVDSGVNYRLPEINRRLARDAEGRLVGYDFWDMDELPYDANPVDSGFFLQRHGTRTASLLLREAPMAELVPYRYPRPDMSRMQALVEHAAANGVGIIGMPLGSNRLEDWGTFEIAAREHPRMLFVISAGNNGRDIDQQPVFPAALGLENLLVVTSADDFLRPAERTNWGRISVDFMLPAENVAVLDYSGRDIRAAGSSYAVARATALAARIKAADPALDAAGIVAVMRREWAIAGDSTRRWVGGGYIADPRAGAKIEFRSLSAPEIRAAPLEGELRLPLDVLSLDGRWSEARIAGILRSAYAILAQCGIVAGDLSLRAFDGPDYLRDLSTGSARTLLEAAGAERLTVVLARDTRMLAAFTGEAFGLGNTRRRPWLTNSVWLMLDVDDPGIALAHEVYHVLANSGVHVEGVANLMQARTRPDSTELTAEQCDLARETGTTNSLLK